MRSRTDGRQEGSAGGVRGAFGAAAALAVLMASAPAQALDWLPVSPEERAMTSEPAAPRAPAIYLYRQVDRDDSTQQESEYLRIKILTEEGLKYADRSIEFFRGRDAIRWIEARVIHPDGRIVKFDGTVYEQTIVKGRGLGWMAKTFTLPDVQVGCIIEYQYRRIMSENVIYDSHWYLSADLFTKRASFSLTKYPYFTLRWSWPLGLPEGTTEPASKRGSIRMDAHDIPAFVTEESMPPENAVRMRVDFSYSTDSAETDPVKFWKAFGKDRFHEVNRFIDQRRAMEKALATIVEPGDDAAAKVRKIYERVQRIRNLTGERERSEEEVKRENLKKNSDVDDVWQHGYADGRQLTWLFLALLRAAGIEADPVLVSSRDEYFFQASMMNEQQLNENVVRVRYGGEELFLDPGSPLTPFGMLPWRESGVKGLCLDKDGGAWVNVPGLPAGESRVVRKATMALDEHGVLKGTLTVTYSGQEALTRRLWQREADETSRKQFLENEIKQSVPTGIDIELTNHPDWQSTAPTLVAQFDVRVPGWASAAGSRWLVPAALFGATERHAFEHATRVYPVYMHWLNEQHDEVEVTLAPRLKVSVLPKADDIDRTAFAYRSKAQDAGGKLLFTRDIAVRFLYLPVKNYDQLYDFYQQVRAGDEEQLVLTVGPPAGAH